MQRAMSQTAAATQFGLIRHAPTAWNLKKRIMGQMDPALAPVGEDAARRWGRRLASENWDSILSSDSRRAVQTAELVNLSVRAELHTDTRLQEQNWGRWSGRRLSEIRAGAKDRLEALEQTGWRFRPPGGEDRRSVRRRAFRALAEAVARWPGARILVVTHEGVIKCLVYHLRGRRFVPSEAPLLLPYHLHRITAGAGRPWRVDVNAIDLR